MATKRNTKKKLTKEDVDITVRAEQDHIPVRGNAIASGDDLVDRGVEEEINWPSNRHPKRETDLWALGYAEGHDYASRGLPLSPQVRDCPLPNE